MGVSERLNRRWRRRTASVAAPGAARPDVLGSPAVAAARRRQLLVFLLVFPLANTLFVATMLYDLGLLNPQNLGRVAIRMWLIFGLALAGLRLLARRWPAAVNPDYFWRQLLTHVVLIVGIGFLLGPTVDFPAHLPRPGSMTMPRVVLMLEVVLYLVVMRMLHQQAREFEAQATVREAELSMLRAQSNPHFLFNTLNLISAEIDSNPANAREIVFDLADLLRSSIQQAQQKLTTVAQEMHLVTLYLTLQQKRFTDRLTFSVEVAPQTRGLWVPSLLLQPVVENMVKYAVAPYAGAAHLTVRTALADDRLCITCGDSGPPFDDTRIREGDGLRILRQTLSLHYRSDYEMSLRSTPGGGVFHLRLPAQNGEVSRG